MFFSRTLNLLHSKLLFFKVLSLSLPVILIFSGCMTVEYNPVSDSKDIMFVGTEKEVSMGRSYAQSIIEEESMTYDPRILNRVNDIGQKIAKHSKRSEVNYSFYVINNEELNAFALPGGYIFLFSGLVEKLDDDELAFVIAHEVAHVAARHSIKRMQAAIASNIILLGSTQLKTEGNISPITGSALLINTFLSGYSQDDELLADSTACKYVEEAGFDPKKGISVVKILENESKKHIGEKIYFRTHPTTSLRIKNIKEKTGMPLDFADLINT